MRTSFALLFMAALATAQIVPISVPGVGEPALNATFSSAAVQQLAAQIAGAPATAAWPNSSSAIPQSTTLSAAVTSALATTATLASTANIQVCNGLLVGAEVMLVTATSPLTLQRGMVGTVASTYAAGTPVTVLRTGGYQCGLKAMWFDGMGAIMSAKLSSTAVSQSQAALAAQQAAIAALAAAAMQ